MKTKSKSKPKPKPKLSPREFIERSLLWPHWPMLPLMKLRADHRHSEATGFLFSHSCDPEPIVYFANIYSVSDMAEQLRAETGKQDIRWGQILDQLKSRRFASLDEVLEHYRID